MTETTTAAEADVPSLLAAANLALNALHECIVPNGAELQISDAMRALRSAIDANLTSAARPLLAAEHKGWKVDYSGLISQVHSALRREPFLGDLDAAEKLPLANDYKITPPTRPLTFDDVVPMTEAPQKGTWYWVTQPFNSRGVEGFAWDGDEADLAALRHRMAYLDKEHALIAARHIFGLKGGEL